MRLLIIASFFCFFLLLNVCDCEEDTENIKCTEMVGSIEKNILLHVPCVLVRLFELIKQCPFNSYNQAFLSIRCSETSKKMKKKLRNLKNRLIKSSNNEELELSKIFKIAKNLINTLQTTPFNLTTHNEDSDCLTAGYALRFYLEETQSKNALRKNFDEENDDFPIELNAEQVNQKIDEFRCSSEIRTDESYFFYLKYMTSSLLGLNSKTPSNESISDVVQVFYPFVEMNDRFSRILPSQSYLSYLILRQQDLFSKKGECDKATIASSKKPKKNKIKIGKNF